MPQDDSQSNYRMVREALLSRAPIAPDNIHPILTDVASPEAAASAYEFELKSFYGAEHLDPDRPLFDVNLLGLGPDGHTASLFPGSAVLAEHNRWVTAVVGVKPEPRITLTYSALTSSRNVAFVVAGKGKQDILARFCKGEESLPATHVHPVGNLYLVSDAAAMGKPIL